LPGNQSWFLEDRMAAKRTHMSFDDVQRFLEGLLGEDLHAKRM
jgi:hypothetical protein